MRPNVRENIRYSKGAKNPIHLEEQIMFSLLPPPFSSKKKQRRLLDIGCGIGTISNELKKKGFQVTGIDFSEVAIKKCSTHGLEAIVSDVDEDGLQFSDAVFDIVWAGDVIEHLFDPIFLFKEIFRVLKKDGYLILSVPNDFNLYHRLNIFLLGKSIQSRIYRKFGQCKHHTFFSWRLLSFMLRESKLSVDSYFSICKIPKTKHEIVAKNQRIGKLFGRIFIVRVKKYLQ